MSESSHVELRREGLDALQRGDLQGALAVLRRSLEQAPDDVDTLNLLSIAESQGGDHQRAVQLLDRALRQSPAAHLHANRGLALQRLGEPAAARAAFQDALRLDPNHRQASERLAALEGPGGSVPAPQTEATSAAGVTPAPGRPNIVPCPGCGAHTRPGASCERCRAPLPAALRIPPRDPHALTVRPPVAGERVGPFTITALRPNLVELANVSPATRVLAGIGMLALLGGIAGLVVIAARGQAEGLLGTAVLPAAGAALLSLYAKIAPVYRFETSGRIERRVFLGLSKRAWRADRMNGVHFASDVPDRDDRESCWLRMEDQQGRLVLQIGPALASEPETANLVPLAVHLARQLRLPVQVDSYPRNTAEELKAMLERLG